MRSGNDTERADRIDARWNRTLRAVQWISLVVATAGLVGGIVWFVLRPDTMPGLN